MKGTIAKAIEVMANAIKSGKYFSEVDLSWQLFSWLFFLIGVHEVKEGLVGMNDNIIRNGKGMDSLGWKLGRGFQLNVAGFWGYRTITTTKQTKNNIQQTEKRNNTHTHKSWERKLNSF